MPFLIKVFPFPSSRVASRNWKTTIRARIGYGEDSVCLGDGTPPSLVIHNTPAS